MSQLTGFTFKMGRVHFATGNTPDEISKKLDPENFADVVVFTTTTHEVVYCAHYKAVVPTVPKLIGQSDTPIECN